MEISEVTTWAQGIYITHAIASVMVKKAKYPNKPLGLLERKEPDKKELTEDDIKKQREQLVISLRLMQVNFNLKKKQIESQECAPS